MNPRVKKVSPNPDYTISLTFENGENKIFDVKPYLEKGIFQDLKTIQYFLNIFYIWWIKCKTMYFNYYTNNREIF